MSVVTDHLAFFRTSWTDRLVDTCVIATPGVGAFNATSGTYPTAPVTHYSGSCLVRPAAGSATEQGEQQVAFRGYSVFIPHSATGVKVDDQVTVTTTRDGVLNGKVLTVRNVASDAYNTIRRLDCEDNQGG